MSKPGPIPRTPLNGRQAPAALNGRPMKKTELSRHEPGCDLTPAALAEFNRLKDALHRRGWLEFTYVGILETATMLHDVAEQLYREIEKDGVIVRLPNAYYVKNPAFAAWMACMRLQVAILGDLTLTPASYRPAPVSGGGGYGRWEGLLQVGDEDSDTPDGGYEVAKV